MWSVRWWHMVAYAMAAITLFWAVCAYKRTQPPPNLAGLPAARTAAFSPALSQGQMRHASQMLVTFKT